MRILEGMAKAALYLLRASNEHHPSPYDLFKLARFAIPGMAPVLVPLRPSSEHILIVRAPGARDQHGCHSTSFTERVLRARRAPGRSLPTSLLGSLRTVKNFAHFLRQPMG